MNFNRTKIKTASILSLLIFTGSVSAVSAPPGETTVIDANTNSTTSIQASELPRSLNLNLNNTALIATPEYSLLPGSYAGTIDYTNKSETYTIEIPETYNYSINQKSVNGTVSVGSSNRTEQLELQYTGNVDPEFSAAITGNISQYFSLDQFRAEGNNIYTPVIEYGVPRDTQKGFYNGTLEITVNNNETENISLNYDFKDEISPEIDSFNVEDVMATNDALIEAVITDNLKVQSADVVVKREVTVEDGNQTITENQTVAETGLEDLNNSNVWSKTLSETSEIGQYHADLLVNDTSGNTAESATSFDVEGLDAVEIINSNFQYEAEKPGEKASEKVFRLNQDSPVDVELSDFTHTSDNSTVEIGVLKPGDSVSTKFSEGESMEVSEEGVYELVVESDSEEDFSGSLNLTLVSQHVGERYRNIEFSGQYVDPEYPDPANFSLGEFEGSIGFDNDEDAVKDRIYYQAWTNAEDCRGVDTWNDCITGYSLDEIPEVKENREEALQKVSNLKLIATVFGGITISTVVFSVLVLKLKFQSNPTAIATPAYTNENTA